jgi:hypothetical protein
LQTPDLAGGEDKLMAYCAQNRIALVRRLEAGRAQRSQVQQNGTILEPGRGARVEFTLQVPRGQVPALLAQVSLWGSATVEAQVGGDGSGPGEPLGLSLDHAAWNAGANTATQPKVLAVEADARARRGAEPQASMANVAPMELQQSGAEPGRTVAGQNAVQNVVATPAPQVEDSISRGGASGAAPAKPDDREIVSLRVILVESPPESRLRGK